MVCRLVLRSGGNKVGAMEWRKGKIFHRSSFFHLISQDSMIQC